MKNKSGLCPTSPTRSTDSWSAARLTFDKDKEEWKRRNKKGRIALLFENEAHMVFEDVVDEGALLHADESCAEVTMESCRLRIAVDCDHMAGKLVEGGGDEAAFHTAMKCLGGMANSMEAEGGRPREGLGAELANEVCAMFFADVRVKFVGGDECALTLSALEGSCLLMKFDRWIGAAAIKDAPCMQRTA